MRSLKTSASFFGLKKRRGDDSKSALSENVPADGRDPAESNAAMSKAAQPKTILVTGAGKRLGKIISEHLAANGWRVAVHYNASARDAAAVAEKIGGVAIGADLSDPDAAPNAVTAAAEALNAPLTAVVNSASFFEHNTASNFTLEDWRRDSTINLLSPILITRRVYEMLPEGMTAAVVNILDQKLWNMNPDHFTYTLSKIGLEGATRIMAQAYAPRMRVVGVAPGLTLKVVGQPDSDFEAVADLHNPLKRPIDPLNIARTVAFALDNTAITGETILVDNGQHLVGRSRDTFFEEETP